MESETPCEKEPGVFYRDILKAYGKVMEKIVRLTIRVTRFIVSVIYTVVTFILTYAAFLLPFGGIGLVFWCVGTLLAVFWDDVTKPIILILIQAYNGTARAWNGFTNSIRYIGVNERFFGTNIRFKLFGVDLPEAPIANANIKGFWQFVYDVLTPEVFKRYVLSKIFRAPGYVPPPKEQNCLTKI